MPAKKAISADAYKIQAAERALTYVEPGMKLGLGTGSTAAKFVDLLGAKVKSGFDVICVPTSEATAAQARALGIRLTTLDDCPQLDLTVDGADGISADIELIKGGGGALLREKIVASASNRFIVIADASKKVTTLGKFPVPVEVVRFGVTATRHLMAELASNVGCKGDIRQRLGRDNQPLVTDGGSPWPPNSLPTSNGAAQNHGPSPTVTLPTALTTASAATMTPPSVCAEAEPRPPLKLAVVAPRPAPTLPSAKSVPAAAAAA